MTKTELIKRMAASANLTQAQAGAAFESMLVAIRGTLARGSELNIAGFGRFLVVNSAARVGRNPRNGKSIKIEAKKTMKFKPADSVKKLLNGGQS